MAEYYLFAVLLVVGGGGGILLRVSDLEVVEAVIGSRGVVERGVD